MGLSFLTSLVQPLNARPLRPAPILRAPGEAGRGGDWKASAPSGGCGEERGARVQVGMKVGMKEEGLLYLASDIVWNNGGWEAGGQVCAQGVCGLGHGAILMDACEQIWKSDRQEALREAQCSPAPKFVQASPEGWPLPCSCPLSFRRKQTQKHGGWEFSLVPLVGTTGPSACCSLVTDSSICTVAFF